jgi:hypothetical protein
LYKLAAVWLAVGVGLYVGVENVFSVGATAFNDDSIVGTVQPLTAYV